MSDDNKNLVILKSVKEMKQLKEKEQARGEIQELLKDAAKEFNSRLDSPKATGLMFIVFEEGEAPTVGFGGELDTIQLVGTLEYVKAEMMQSSISEYIPFLDEFDEDE